MSLASAHAALAAAGLPPQGLYARHGWANEAWLGETAVVRISSGRLRGALAHEAATLEALDAPIPTATPIAHGRVTDLGLSEDRSEVAEWLVSRRVAGETLAVTWPDLPPRQRREVGRELGEALRALHSSGLDLQGPRWWLDAQSRPEELHNCYRPPPRLAPALVDAVRCLRGADETLLDDVATLIEGRLDLFVDDVLVFTHTDIHAHNLLVSAGGRLAAILDWEGAHLAAADIELDMFLRYIGAAHAFPERPGASVKMAEGDMLELIGHVATAYPDLFAGSHLRERLEVYDAHWHLIQLLVNDRLHPNSEGRDPAWDRLGALLEGRSHLARIDL